MPSLRTFAFCACATLLSTQFGFPADLPDGPGKAVVQKVCSGCHAAELVATHHDTKDGWEVVVSNMVDKGANGTDEEFNTIIDYLAAHFPKKPEPKPGGNGSPEKTGSNSH